jgi:hypothetical protein
VNERITDAELRVIEGLEEGNRAALLFARRLVDEVRRLRGLIAFLGEPEIAEVVPPSLTQDRDEQVGKGILHEGPWTLTVRQRGEEIPRLMAEARAIREERGRG